MSSQGVEGKAEPFPAPAPLLPGAPSRSPLCLPSPGLSQKALSLPSLRLHPGPPPGLLGGCRVLTGACSAQGPVCNSSALPAAATVISGEGGGLCGLEGPPAGLMSFAEITSLLRFNEAEI